MSKLRWIAASLLAAMLIFAVACGGGSDDDDADAAADPSQSQTGAGIAGSETLNLASVAATLEDIESFRFNLSFGADFDLPDDDSDDAATAALFMALLGNIEAEGAYVAPDRMALTMTVFGMEIKTISIGEESWTDDGNGWEADSGGGTFSMPFDFSTPLDLAFDLLPVEELAGAKTSRETVNGFETTRYSFDRDSLEALAGETAGIGDLDELDTLTLDLWLTNEGLPVRMKIEVAGESEGSDIAFDFEFNITDLNDPGISIERPI